MGLEPPPPAANEPEPPKIFVSYRRSDTGAHAYLLHERLGRRFGEENVFLDVTALQPGVDWRRAIHARANASGVLLALIGPQWLALMKASTQRGVVEEVDDVARQELELALTNQGDVTVVPVLVDDTSMPPAHELPRSLQALSDRQAERVRLTNYEGDVGRLIARLESLGATRPPERPPPAPPPPEVTGTAHHQRVMSQMCGAGHVVVVLGSRVNHGCGALPDAERLAADLARRFEYPVESHRPRLAEVAEYVNVTWGTPDLYLSLKENLSVECEPGKVHRFLAGFPATLERQGRTRRHPLILTTNLDATLERSFEAAGEPFDLAIYLASTGTFAHFPWEGDPVRIAEPNRYHAFPIGDDLELSRTLIVKIHGAIGGRELAFGGEEDFVITEDNYIDYLSGTSVEEIVPFQILQKLRSSHCLFLGCDIANWYSRVLVKRVWGARIRAKSWAVQEDPGEFEQILWRECGVEVVTEPLDDYVDALAACLRAPR